MWRIDLKAFKIHHEKDYPLDERDHPLDERDLPLVFQIQADNDLEKQFGLDDSEYDDIDNISPVIDKQMQDSSENPEGGQFQDELDGELDAPLDGSDPNPQSEEDMDLNAETEEEPEQDPNFQGIIRTVKGANLVYKRKNASDTYDELWLINVGRDMKKESQIKRAILAGTDIEPNGETSTDGKQQMELSSIGNIQFISLTNLPS